MCSVCMLTVRKQRRRHGQSSVQTVLQKECTNLQFAANQRCSQVPCRTSKLPGLHLAQFPGSGSSYANSTWSWLGCDWRSHIHSLDGPDQLISCNCLKGHCVRGRCSCRKNVMSCTGACGCVECSKTQDIGRTGNDSSDEDED